MQTVNVIGAGFSGLVTAYFLTKAGRRVRVFEKTDCAGGLIRTHRTEHGLVETAANGLLNSARLEMLCADIGVPLLETRREGRRRFIYRGQPRQLPLLTSEIARLGFGLAKNVASLRPKPFESIAAWGERVLGKAATDYLLTPALGGIYAGDPRRLSASLIFGGVALPQHLHTYRPQKGKSRGTVAPSNGMQELIEGLCDYLKKSGVEFNFNQAAPQLAGEPVIVCLAARAAATYLNEASPELSERLNQIEMLSLVTATTFYEPSAVALKGFGCLFPGDQGFRARGVLFNDSIFEGRGPYRSETWIFGGALDRDVITLDDVELSAFISNDRQQLFASFEQPMATHITRWNNALPHYSIELERILTTLPAPPQNIALCGNYLGRIGLAKLLERAAYVVDHTVKTL